MMKQPVIIWLMCLVPGMALGNSITIEGGSYISLGSVLSAGPIHIKLNGTSCEVISQQKPQPKPTVAAPQKPPVTQHRSNVCKNSPVVACMGALTEWPGGTMLWKSVPPGQTHVWHFDYDTVANNSGTFMLMDGYMKKASLSEHPNDFTLKFPCQITQSSPQQPLFYAPVGKTNWQQCGFKNNTRYFFNIRSTQKENDPYTLTVR